MSRPPSTSGPPDLRVDSTARRPSRSLRKTRSGTSWKEADDMWANGATLDAPKGLPAVLGCLLSFREEMKNVGQVLLRSPWIVAVCAIALAIMVGVGIWAVRQGADSEVSRREAAAVALALEAAALLETSIALEALPAKTLGIFVQDTPDYPTLGAKFDQLAAQIIAADPFGYLVCMELAPSAVVRNVYPWGPNKQYDPIGHDLLYGAGQPSAGTTSTDGGPLPDVRALVVETIESGRTSLAGPFRLFNNSGGYVAFARHPVFISNVTSPDLTFNRPSQPTNCPAACYDADARRLFWGLAIAIVDFDALSYKIFTMLEVDGYYYRMTRPADSSFDPAGGPAVVDIVASAAGGVLDPVQAAVRIPGGEWQLYLSPVGGWRPGWARGLSALVVLVSLVVDLLLLHLLVYFVRRRLLLLAIIPPKALALVSRGRPFVEHFGCVTVLFSDIVSYTSIAAEMSPLQVVRMLDDLYSIFDVLCEKHGLYKVETIGDAVMIVGGCPEEAEPVDAAARVALMAQDMISAVSRFVTEDGIRLQIRIGIHSGPIVAAVIGRKMPRYCLFGDTVNVASRMESTGMPMRVQLSNATAELLQRDQSFRLEARGPVDVKNKGVMYTWWLTTPEDGSSTATSSLPPSSSSGQLARQQSNGQGLGGGGGGGPSVSVGSSSSTGGNNSGANTGTGDVGVARSLTATLLGPEGAQLLQRQDITSTSMSGAAGECAALQGVQVVVRDT